MKRICILLVTIYAVILCASAQKGEKSAGLSLGYGSEIESVGLGVRFQYGITDPIRIAPSFTYFFKKDNVSMWDIDLNAHYLFPVSEGFKAYPLAGLIISHYSVDFGELGKYLGAYDIDTSETKFGINLGGGAQYEVTKDINLFGEIKYSIVSDIDQFVILIGAAYKF